MITDRSGGSRADASATSEVLLYPRLCRLVLQLLLDHPTESFTSGALAHILQRLASAAAKSEDAAAALCEEGLISVILTGALMWVGCAMVVR